MYMWRASSIFIRPTTSKKETQPEMTDGQGPSVVYVPGTTRKSLLTVGIVFVLSAFVMLAVFRNFPQLDA